MTLHVKNVNRWYKFRVHSCSFNQNGRKYEGNIFIINIDESLQ
jgi:hypothetical protein